MRPRELICAALFILSLTGCRSLVEISSTPSGADALVRCGGNTVRLTTPGQVRVRRNEACTLTVEKDGYERVTVPMVGAVAPKTESSALVGTPSSNAPFLRPESGGIWTPLDTSGAAPPSAVSITPKAIHVALEPSKEVPQSRAD